MKLKFNTTTLILAFASAILLTACYCEDPGPVQEYQKDFTEADFDRIEMGDAFNVTVQQGDLFLISAKGDRRNIDDLIVEKKGSTLWVHYKGGRNRKHDTN